MIANINGITVQGTPEEIHKFKEMNMNAATMTNVNIHVNNPTMSLEELSRKIAESFRSKGTHCSP